MAGTTRIHAARLILIVASFPCLLVSGACGKGGGQDAASSTVAVLRSASSHVRFNVHVPRRVPPGYTFRGVDEPATKQGPDAIAIASANSSRTSIFVKETGPGVAPEVADPATGVADVAGTRWTVYGNNIAIARRFSDGVTIEIEGDGYAPVHDLLTMARGLR